MGMVYNIYIYIYIYMLYDLISSLFGVFPNFEYDIRRQHDYNDNRPGPTQRPRVDGSGRWEQWNVSSPSLSSRRGIELQHGTASSRPPTSF